MRVHTSADLIAVKIDDVTIKFRPLTYLQRKEVLGCVTTSGGKVMQDHMEMIRLAVKYAVKSIDGLEDANGAYAIEHDEDGVLKETSLDTIMNIEALNMAVSMGAVKIATSGPFTSLEGDDGEALEGVEVIAGKNGHGGN